VIRAPRPQRTGEPVIGYRCYRADGLGRLQSTTRGDLWTADVHEATCELASHPAPGRGCECGIHALGSLATARRYAERRWLLWPGLTTSTVIGAVRLQSGPGRPILAGELAASSGIRGGRRSLQYRAPYAELLALLDDGAAARRAGGRLGLPVLAERDAGGRPLFEAYAREHGVQLEAEAATPPDRRPPAAAGSATSPSAGGRPVAWVLALAVGLVLLATARLLGALGWAAARLAGRLAWWLSWWGLRVLWAALPWGLWLALVIPAALCCLRLAPPQRRR
jgi:hypothetical protein